MYCIQHCFICRPSDSTVPEEAGIELLPPQNRIAYQENDKGRFYTCNSTDVLMYLNMKLYQRINVLLYRLFLYKCTGVSMYVCIDNQSYFNRQRM
jgi:hypothetical protein